MYFALSSEKHSILSATCISFCKASIVAPLAPFRDSIQLSNQALVACFLLPSAKE